ncbi:MAG: hypothetical protein Q9207_003485 [Kuettlingeria erythrocarpa]
MSSVFTFDPDPPRALVSPWPEPASGEHRRAAGEAAINDQLPSVMHLTAFAVEGLEPEPQDGPTEYKLHLLLRPRRSFSALSTVQKVSGSHLSKSRASRSGNGSPLSLPKASAATASSTQARQSRLQNLTTQLLWRLQQSSPHHSASRSDLVVPILPDAVTSMGASTVPGKLLPGLGDSQGALYEIGVADDGTLVGLTIDELDESLAVLRAMASSLGCKVTLLRRIIVGDCQWLEQSNSAAKIAPNLRKEKLWVAEALVSPDLPFNESKLSVVSSRSGVGKPMVTNAPSVTGEVHRGKPATDQLRVSLTGSTTSGKSSLLGTLSTSTLDNGRGKRLPLIVVITKLDLASISALKPTLGKILSLLKSAGRRPEILSCASDESSFRTQEIDQQHEMEVVRLLATLPEAEPCSMVPIVLTSAVTGKGVDKVHALLRHLPIPERPLPFVRHGSPASALVSPHAVFHVDEIFAANSAPNHMRQGMEETSIDSILSGYLQRGGLSIGQEVIIGPFSTNAAEADIFATEVRRANSYPRIKGSTQTITAKGILPRPFSGDFITPDQRTTDSVRATAVWRRARVCSIRNLRLPVHYLGAEHAGGTVGLGPPDWTAGNNIGPLSTEDRIRKGMVLMSMASEQCRNLPQAFGGFVAMVESTESPIAYHAYHPGSSVIAYIASIRAPAKVLDFRMLPQDVPQPDEIFDFEDDAGEEGDIPRSSPTARETRLFKFVVQFLASDEWFEVGSKVLVMPASGFRTSSEKGDRARSGLDGLVGRITQGLE